MQSDTAQTLLSAWKDQPAVDHHCHPLRRWPFELTALDLRSAFTEALDPEMAERHVIHSSGYQAALHRIAVVLGCEPTEAAVLERRNAADPQRYARQLLDSAPTEVMLVDHGFSSRESFTLQEQQRATGIAQREIIRLETLAETLVKSAKDPREWFAATRSALRGGIEGGAVGVKSICAYRASLELQPVDTDTLGVAFSALRLRVERGQSVRLVGNSLCHALLFEAAQECQELDVPLQVHCGFGDPDEDLATTSPLGLRPLFIDPAYHGLRIALLHCYPYHREAAYLCAVFPGAYMDLSLTIPSPVWRDFARCARHSASVPPASCCTPAMPAVIPRSISWPHRSTANRWPERWASWSTAGSSRPIRPSPQAARCWPRTRAAYIASPIGRARWHDMD